MNGSMPAYSSAFATYYLIFRQTLAASHVLLAFFTSHISLIFYSSSTRVADGLDDE